jgi:hypothetical protein
MIAQDAADRLRQDGFVTFPNILDAPMLERLRATTQRLIDTQPASVRQHVRYQGTNIDIWFQDPALTDIVCWPRSLDTLRQLGFSRPKYWSGYIISKPPGGPPLYWHQDWPFWSDPISASPQSAQLFLMYYLVDTRRENGCLRVIPESHRRRVELHDLLPPAHESETYGADLSHPMFRADPLEIDVPVKAGDLVIGDARVLHAAHPNRSDGWRTVMTLWYYPSFDEMPPAIRRAVTRGDRSLPAGLSDRQRRRIEPLRPVYDGPLDVAPAKWDRTPAKYLARSAGA